MTANDIRMQIMSAKIAMCQEVLTELIPTVTFSPARMQKINKISELIVSLEKRLQRLKRGSYAAKRIRNKGS